MIEEGDESGALRLIYSLYIQNDCDLYDEILADIDERRLAPFLLVALLTITAPLRSTLQQRASFFTRAKEAISELRGRETAERTLIGLE
jgi:hypothetical protein